MKKAAIVNYRSFFHYLNPALFLILIQISIQIINVIIH